jgi:hypothetical protein
MVNPVNPFWGSGKYLSSVFGNNKDILNNLGFFIIPLSFFLLILAVISTFLYIFYASYFAEKLNEDENIEKLYNVKQNVLAEAQLSMIRYFENYRISSDAAIILLLFIIALCCIYLVLKLK